MTQLSGMKEICVYVRRSEATVLDWIRHLGLPAKKLNGGIWESDTNLIDEWRVKQILAKPGLKSNAKKRNRKRW